MEIVLNSKFFTELSVEQLGEKTIELGYDGVDICVRPGHPIHVDNVIEALPKAMKVWSGQNLTCPLATAATDITDPNAPEVEGLYAACAEAGIPRLKIGFWRFNEGDDYWQVIDAARRDLERFSAFSEKYGVQTCYQIHSGPCIGSNCAGLMHLIKGFDPQHIGAYPDPGHLALDGEDWAMGLAMIGDYLSIIGIKDALYLPQPDHTPPYIPCFVKVGDGCVDWERYLGLLCKSGFEGPLTVHTEYRFDESIIRQVGYAETTPPNLEQWAKEDAVYLRNMLSSLREK
jgi:sugar phosphate isomerase/epimerase